MKVKLRKFRSSDPLKDGLLSALRSEGCKNQGWLAGWPGLDGLHTPISGMYKSWFYDW